MKPSLTRRSFAKAASAALEGAGFLATGTRHKGSDVAHASPLALSQPILRDRLRPVAGREE